MLLAMIQDMLNMQNHDAAVARNGQEALEVAQGYHPELILIDIHMPVMGGLEATRRLREIPEFADTPIIALTASTDMESIEKQAAAGCTDHLSKPVLSDELFAVLERYLGHGDGNALSVQ